MPTTRPDIDTDFIKGAHCSAEAAVRRSVNKHGKRTFSSIHEMYGVLKEEFNEVEQAIFAGNQHAAHEELMDLVAVGIFGMACIKQGEMDW